MTNIRGYAGFYNGHLIRSSYEYVMTILLLKEKISYKYEEKTYFLKKLNVNYKPDFFLYNDKNILEKIIEVKGGRDLVITKAKEKAEIMLEEYNINVEVYDYNKLKEECIKHELNINDLINDWKNNKSTTNSSIISFGENNAMFGNKHTIDSKNKISESKKEMWKNNRDFIIQRTKEGMSKVDMKTISANSNRHFAQYENRECKYCNKIFTTNTRTSQIFCSQKCAIVYKNKNRVYMLQIPQNIKKEMQDIALQNKSLIMETKLNKTKNTLDLIFSDLMKKYNIKDYRTLAFYYYGYRIEEARKNLIKGLKEYLENIC